VDFTIQQVTPQDIQDKELSSLLNEVYVKGGYCTPEEAENIFAPQSVKQRGVLFSARENKTSLLAGFVIVVPFDSPASKMAKENECEMHLLGVAEAHRGNNLGNKLIQCTLGFAKESKFNKMILWTQEPMKTAQGLYERNGFEYQSTFEKNGRTFLLYEKNINTEI